MTGFNAKIGAAATLGLAAVYLVISLVTGHPAASEPPPDLSARTAGLNVWKTLALMARAPANIAVRDIRAADQFEVFHLPGAANIPGAGAAGVARSSGGKRTVLLVADKDAAAARMAGEIKKIAAGVDVHYLEGGARAWYLALELPVPLFREKPAPFGYADAMAKVRIWLKDPSRQGGEELQRAIGKLSALGVQPSLLQGKKKPGASGKKKKIAGGCG